MTQPTPPGWYPSQHPGDSPGTQRYWDGTAWTDQVAAPSAPAAPAADMPTQAEKNRKTNKKILKWIGIPVVVVIIIAIASSGGGGSPKKTGSEGTAPTSPAASTSPAAATHAPKPAPPVIWPAHTYTGRGDKILRVNLGGAARIMTVTAGGSDNFVITELSSSGDDLEIPVNVIGRYSGTTLINKDDDDTAALKVEAAGRWTITIKDLLTLPKWNGATTLTGRGDKVVAFASGLFDGLTSLKVTHAGQDNFVVTTYSADSSDIPVNEIGRYSGEVQIEDGTVFATVEADGTWTMTKTG